MAEFETVRRAGAGTRTAAIDAGLRAHMSKVYGLMSVAMALTGLVAWAFSGLVTSADPSITGVVISKGVYLNALGATVFMSPLKWLVMLAPFGFVIFLSARINKLQTATAQLVFYTFAAVMGISISSIFLVYTGASITQIFLVTASAFAGLSLYGYTTKKDISGWGSFLIMGVIGLLIAIVVNLFLASPALQFAISAIGVLIFAGLTAYDTQRIKNTYLQMASSPEGVAWLGKAAIMGALSLYINFLNMFMFLLSLFGNRN